MTQATPALPWLLGGSWVVISGVISPLTLLITPLITMHEPASGALNARQVPKVTAPELRERFGLGTCGGLLGLRERRLFLRFGLRDRMPAPCLWTC